MKNIKYYLFAFVFVLLSWQIHAQDNRIAIRKGQQKIFVSGMNLAWGNFAGDLVNYPEASFPKALDELESSGANALRWWLHTNGSQSPSFDAAGNVVGLHPNTIPNMKRVLDSAYNRGIVISMCLWSFDMLQNQGQNQQHMKQLLEDPVFTQTYIDNALIPILKEIGDHPAVLCWEIFNEPEGMTTEFGWTPIKTEMKYVQQFINRVAGAIRRESPGVLVSNGSWSFKASTDVGGNFNYYRDDRLIAAGGDQDGYLDFYQVHYYPEHFDNTLSPFHNPASYWGLTKPIVIGEFPAKGIDQKANPPKTTVEAYEYLYDNGYAGAMSWTWTGHDGFGNIIDARPAMLNIWKKYPAEIVVKPSANHNFRPKIMGQIPDIKVKTGTSENTEFNIKDYFFDDKDGAELAYTVAENTDANIATVEILSNGALLISFLPEADGKTSVTLKATDSGGASSSLSFFISIRDPGGNLALFQPVQASSTENATHLPEHAVDGDLETRWSSEYADLQTLRVDLGSVQKINRVVLSWEAAHAKEYTIQGSKDGNTWNTLFAKANGTGGNEEIKFKEAEARYVRLNAIKRASAWGFSLFEFQIFYDAPVTAVYKNNPGLLKIFPNPTDGKMYVTAKEEAIKKIDLYDIKGVIKYSYICPSNTPISVTEIDLTELTKGIYFIRINSEKNIISDKIIKN